MCCKTTRKSSTCFLSLSLFLSSLVNGITHEDELGHILAAHQREREKILLFFIIIWLPFFLDLNFKFFFYCFCRGFRCYYRFLFCLFAYSLAFSHPSSNHHPSQQQPSSRYIYVHGVYETGRVSFFIYFLLVCVSISCNSK